MIVDLDWGVSIVSGVKLAMVDSDWGVSIVSGVRVAMVDSDWGVSIVSGVRVAMDGVTMNDSGVLLMVDDCVVSICTYLL